MFVLLFKLVGIGLLLLRQPDADGLGKGLSLRLFGVLNDLHDFRRNGGLLNKLNGQSLTV
jgi:hypothetical protein